MENQRPLHVGIVGATGVVGKEFLILLEKRAFPIASLRLFGSARSAGKRVRWSGGGINNEITVEDLAQADPTGLDLALFSAGKGVSLEHAPRFAAAGVVVVDNSSAFRRDPAIPLVVPEVNPGDLATTRSRIIANPNCSTIILLMALAPIHRALDVVDCVVSTYQAVSGAGKAAVDELFGQARAFAAGDEPRCEAFDRPIFLNVLPQIGPWQANGDSEEEAKFTQESRKILGDNTFRCHATCVRVPVERCHSESVYVRLGRATSEQEILALLRAAPGVALDDLATPRELANREEVFVSRVRVDEEDPRVLRFWVVSDQLWKGAALNSIQIAEAMGALGRFDQ